MTTKTRMGWFKSTFQAFFFFYTYLGYRIFWALSLSLFVGVLDGFGLAMFLPLLQIADGGSEASYASDGMGNLSFIVDGLNYFNVPFTLSSVLLVMMLFFTMKGLFRFIEGYYRIINQRYFIRRLRFQTIDLLAGYRYKSFVLSDAGRIQNTLSGEVERVVTAYRMYFSAIQFGALVLVYVFLAFLANPQFAILVIIGGGLTNLFYKKIYSISKKLSRELTEQNHAFQGLIIQMVAFFKYMKATGGLAAFSNRLKNSIQNIENHAKRMGTLSVALSSLREPVVIAVVVTVIIFQVNVMEQPLGLIMLSLLFFYRSLTFLMNIQNNWNIYLGVSGSLENMVAFTVELKAAEDVQGTGTFGAFHDKISLRDVDFFYGDTQILKGVTLDIRKLETVALVGESGSGKTTLLNILSGLMLPDRGDLVIDGVSMKSLDRRTFQQRIGYITQDPVIFNDSIYNNVTLWAEPSQDNVKRFESVLRQAAIADFVYGLPDKHETLLGNNGIMVSGGQRQRLSIARELFKEVDFLFFDEATSALDSETERAIQENLENLKGRFTMVMIAHRLSTVRNADQIVLLRNGQIEAMGSFDALAEKSKIFKRMVQLQEF